MSGGGSLMADITETSITTTANSAKYFVTLRIFFASLHKALGI
jgi:hypothetical protein